MRVKARGAYTMAGTAKQSGNAYDMCKLVIEVKQETTANKNMKRVGLGLDQKELDLSHECFERMQNMGLVWPCDLDLTVGARVGFRGLESVIEDVKAVSLKAAA